MANLNSSFVAFINQLGVSTISPEPIYIIQEQEVLPDPSNQLVSFYDGDTLVTFEYQVSKLGDYDFDHFSTKKVGKVNEN